VHGQLARACGIVPVARDPPPSRSVSTAPPTSPTRTGPAIPPRLVRRPLHP